MPGVTRKSIINQLPPAAFRSTADDRRLGIVPPQCMRDILDTFVSRVEDSPAYTVESQLWTAHQQFTSAEVGRLAVGVLVCDGFGANGVQPIVGKLPPLTVADQTNIEDTYGVVTASIIQNMRNRIAELESTLVVLGFVERSPV
jgi:hypothetical protein